MIGSRHNFDLVLISTKIFLRNKVLSQHPGSVRGVCVVKMAKVNQSMMKTVSIHQSKIDVVKFDGINNFGIRRCEVMDALNA